MRERRQRRRALVGAVALSLSVSAITARARACDPARIVAPASDLPAEWQRALADLALVTTQEGHLWSCAGGELRVELSPDGAGAILRRRDARGREVVRHVPTAGDLVPTAEALLAWSALPSPPPAFAAPPAPTSRARPPPPTPAGPQDPRLVAEALAGVRYGGTLRSVWGAGTLRIAVPIDAWSVAVWARYGVPYVLDRVPADFSMSDAGFGLSLGRRIIAAPVELHATFDPSLGFVTMEGGADPKVAQGAKLDGRLGAGMRAVFRWSRMWRGVVALDGEVAPASAAKARRIDPSLPPLPAYSVGASFGVDAVIR